MTGRPRRPGGRKGVRFDDARAMLLALPGVEEAPCYGTPGYRVRGKLLARIWPDLETLVVKCGDDERDVRMQLDPGTYFVTDHYRGYPTVLVRLASVDAEDLRGLIEKTWRRNAPKTLVAAHDAGGGPGGALRRGARPAGIRPGGRPAPRRRR